MTATWILAIVIIFTAADWLAIAKGWRWLEYICKPAVIIGLIAWLWVVSHFLGWIIWFALGLFFSLAGDVFLMLPKEQFLGGLVAFLMAHLAYLVGFNPSLLPLNLVSLLMAVGVGIVAARLYRRIADGLEQSGQAKLKMPVMVYSAAISLMLLSALLTLLRPDWQPFLALLASTGALLFFISDSFLAWNRFVAPLPHDRLRVMIPYHLAQLFITLAAGLHFTSL